MVTSRITFEKVLMGSKEEQDGYDFVAIMPIQQRRSKDNVGNVMEWINIIPFSVTDDGVKC